MNYLRARTFARQLRKNQTKAELSYWERVRKRRFLGYRFNRQFIIEVNISASTSKFFIADFYCHELKLVVEIDGKIHDFQKEYDQERERLISTKGLSVLRFKNEDVMENWDKVCGEMEEWISRAGSTDPE